MDYKKIYDSLVEYRKCNPVDSNIYSERHHILPKSLGGKNNKENIVRLTAREHYVAHHLLARIHGKIMWAAFAFMAKRAKKFNTIKITSRIYEKARDAHAEFVSDFMSTNGHPLKGKKLSDEHKQKIKAKINENGAYWQGRNLSKEHKKKLSDAAKLREVSPDHMKKMHDAKRNKPLSDESKERISRALKGHPVSDDTKEKIRVALTGRRCPNHIRAAIKEFMTKNNPNIGRKHTAETRERMSNSKKGVMPKNAMETLNTTVTCPNCNKQGRIGTMKRWHFDKCRINNSLLDKRVNY